MRETGFIDNISKNMEGDLIIAFRVEESQMLLEEIKKLNSEKVVLEVKKYRDKRSLDANAYFWRLCDKIARVLGSDKDTIYLLMLKDAGVFVDVTVRSEAVDSLKKIYRTCELLQVYDKENLYGEFERYAEVRCYLGSHVYDTAEMSHLINHTVNTASDLGIDTLTTDEQAHMLSLWNEKQVKMKL